VWAWQFWAVYGRGKKVFGISIFKSVVVAVLVGFRVLEWSSANLCCAYVSRICMFNLNILDFFLGLEISTGLLILIIYILYMVGNASFLNTF